jgi:hypothetical protein
MFDEGHTECIDLATYLNDLKKRLVLSVTMPITPNPNKTIQINKRLIKDTTGERDVNLL